MRPAFPITLLLSLFACCGVGAQQAPASPGTETTAAIAVPRHVVAGGGGHASGGAFTIRGSIGQADADPLQPSTGGVFAVVGGFWPGSTPRPPLDDALFADGFEPSLR